MSKQRKPRKTRARPQKRSTTRREHLGRGWTFEPGGDGDVFYGNRIRLVRDRRRPGSYMPKRDERFHFAPRGIGFYRLGSRYRVTCVRRGLVYFRRQLGNYREGPPQSLPLPEFRNRVVFERPKWRGKMKRKPKSEAKRPGNREGPWRFGLEDLILLDGEDE